MSFPRLTWAGLLIATFGWGLLLVYPLFASHGLTETRDPARFVLIFGENGILTGFALALLGVLERVLVFLSRSTGVGQHIGNNIVASTRSVIRNAMPQAGYGQQMYQTQQAPQPQPQQAPQLTLQRSTSANANEVITRGSLNGRDYVLFRDGSVLIETLLGPRRFPSIAEAQEFIGAN
jgi:hypothetical protein